MERTQVESAVRQALIDLAEPVEGYGAAVPVNENSARTITDAVMKLVVADAQANFEAASKSVGAGAEIIAAASLAKHNELSEQEVVRQHEFLREAGEPHADSRNITGQ